jgi:hypothetical protein
MGDWNGDGYDDETGDPVVDPFATDDPTQLDAELET